MPLDEMWNDPSSVINFSRSWFILIVVFLVTILAWRVLNATPSSTQASFDELRATVDNDEEIVDDHEEPKMDAAERLSTTKEKWSFELPRRLEKKELKEVIRSFKDELEVATIGHVQHEYHTRYVRFDLFYDRSTSALSDIGDIIDSWRRRFSYGEQTREDDIQQATREDTTQQDNTHQLLLDLRSEVADLRATNKTLSNTMTKMKTQMDEQQTKMREQQAKMNERHTRMNKKLSKMSNKFTKLNKTVEESKTRDAEMMAQFEELREDMFGRRMEEHPCEVWWKRFVTGETAGLNTASTDRLSNEDRGNARAYWGDDKCVVTGLNKSNRPSNWPEGNAKFPFVKLGHLYPRADEKEGKRRYPPHKYARRFRIDSARNMMFMRFDIEFGFDRQILSFVEKFGQFHCAVLVKNANQAICDSLEEYLHRENRREESYRHSDEEIERILHCVDVEDLNDRPLLLPENRRPYGRVLFDHLVSAVRLRDESELVDPNYVESIHVLMDMGSSSTISSSTVRTLASCSETVISDVDDIVL